MEINIGRLYNIPKLDIDEIVILTNIDQKLIKRLDPVKVKGFVRFNLSEEIEINLDVSGKMYLDDAVTLEEIPYDFAFKIAESYAEDDENFQKFVKNKQNILDINEILWENIVLEVPIRLTKNAGKKLQGEGWELNS